MALAEGLQRNIRAGAKTLAKAIAASNADMTAQTTPAPAAQSLGEHVVPIPQNLAPSICRDGKYGASLFSSRGP
jgi:hypothetical protein